MKPLCSRRLLANNVGLILDKITCANTFSGTESNVILLSLLHSDLDPFPLYSEMIIP